jgi:predicted dehydrogenase
MINICLIGAGLIAEAHIAGAQRNRKTKISVILDMNLERARVLAEKYNIGKITDNIDDILFDKNITMVILALPTFLHYEWIKKIAKAGKDILTEKPLCRTVKQARRIIDICRKYKVRLAVGYMRRFSPARLKIRSLILSGALGRPVTWQIFSVNPRLDYNRGANNWMWDKDKGGGYVMDGSIHDFDFACWVLGRPVKMFARSGSISEKVSAPTHLSTFINFENGDGFSYNNTWQEGDFGKHEASVITGPKGTIALDHDFGFTWYYSPGKKRIFNWKSNNLVPKGLGGYWLFYKQIDAFIKNKKCISLSTGTEALDSLWISENIIEAGTEGRKFIANLRKE